MRILCDACETAAAILFCAADEAALCRACDDKVHMCNKLASRHVRVRLGEPSEVSRCDICENAPAFFYCETDGSSLCLQCDMIVHVGGKRTHGRYLLLRQRVEFPTEKPGSLDEAGSQRVVNNHSEAVKRERAHMSTFRAIENQRNHSGPNNIGNNIDDDDKMENNLIDLNARPQKMHGQASQNQERENALVENNHEPENVVPDGYIERDCDK